MESRHAADSRTACSKSGSSKPFTKSTFPHKKPAWVVADWKHRVPESPLPRAAPAANSLNGSQRAKAVEERRSKLRTEYACVHHTIDSILNRCKQVQQRLGGSASSISPGGGLHSPTFLSARSKLLFDAPDQQEAATEQAAEAPHGIRLQQQQYRPISPSWAGAIDLNPGFSFAPGTPERVAAACPDELPMVLARLTGLMDGMRHVDLSKLHHREVLQAGIQQLNGEFYGALLSAAVKQQQQEQARANRPLGVIPASWQAEA